MRRGSASRSQRRRRPRSTRSSRSCASRSAGDCRLRSAIASCTAVPTTARPPWSATRSSPSLERFVPLAPLHQPNNLRPDPRDTGAATATLAGRLLRHRLPSGPSRRRRSLRDSRAALRRRRAPLRISRPFLRIHRRTPERGRARHCQGPGRRRPSRQRRFHVRHLGRQERRKHDGLHGARWPADGHAPGAARCWRRALPHDGEGNEREGYRAPPLQRMRPQGAFRHQQRRARTARQLGSARQAGARLLRLSDRAVCRNAGRRDGRHRRLRVHRRHRGERAGHSRGGDAAPRLARRRARRRRQRQGRAADLAQGVARRLLRHSDRRGADDRAPHAACAARERLVPAQEKRA